MSLSTGSARPENPAGPGPVRRRLSVADYVRGVLSRDRTVLARAITLVESDSPAHSAMAREVLRELAPHTGKSIRIGITGVPGVGKSTFIESLGCLLCAMGHHLAVLAVDPSSSITRGSILGDKTRMMRLVQEPNAFIRPSPSGGHLGGVTRKTQESILVCEAAGADVVFVETVGVGQSEFAVRSLVDFFLLLTLTGAGDELQGIKRGVLEMADAIVIHKADGDNRARAEAEQTAMNMSLHYLKPITEGWRTETHLASALTGDGIAEIWSVIERFRGVVTRSGTFERRRKSQLISWFHSLLQEELRARFLHHPRIAEALPQIENEIRDGSLPVTTAVDRLLTEFLLAPQETHR